MTPGKQQKTKASKVLCEAHDLGGEGLAAKLRTLLGRNGHTDKE